MGHNPVDEWGEYTGYSDAIPALAIVGFSEIGLHMLGVRWILAVPLKIIGAMMYVVLIILGSLDPGALFNLVLLSGILWLSLIAKRKLEIKERQAHCRVVNEGQNHSEADFQGECRIVAAEAAAKAMQVKSQKDRRRREFREIQTQLDGRTDPRPQHIDPDSESIFGNFFDTSSEDLEGLIAKLAALGKQEHWLVQTSE